MKREEELLLRYGPYRGALTSGPPPVHVYAQDENDGVEDEQQGGAQQLGHSHEGWSRRSWRRRSRRPR